MIPQLMTSSRLGPRKRFRGKKGYFRQVRKDAERFELNIDKGSWWDVWHYHADWAGWGNVRWRYRREHLLALSLVFRKIAASSERFSTPFQSWIYLSGRDAGEDATYLHTPNQNQTPFPVAISGIARMRSSSLVQEFAALLPGFSVRVGEVRSFDEDAEPPRVVSSFFVYCEGIGVPLASFQDER